MNRPQHQPELVGQTDLLADIFQVVQLHTAQAGQLVGQLRLLDKGARSDHGADFGRFAGGLHGLGSG